MKDELSVDEGVVEAVMQMKDCTRDGAIVMIKLLPRKELLEIYLEYEGIIGYTETVWEICNDKKG